MKTFDQKANSPHYAADLLLGLLAFWFWALLTNAHSGRLVHTGGRKTGTASDRKAEFAAIVLLSVITIGLYVACYHPTTRLWSWVFVGIATFLAIMVLGTPD